MWTALIIIIIALSVVTLYLFCIAPGRGRGNLLVNFEKMMIAHRGLFNTEEAPENSLAAFKLAIEKGYAIELDTQVSSDGEVVVFHDATLNRMCGFGKDAAAGLNRILLMSFAGDCLTVPMNFLGHCALENRMKKFRYLRMS